MIDQNNLQEESEVKEGKGINRDDWTFTAKKADVL